MMRLLAKTTTARLEKRGQVQGAIFVQLEVYLIQVGQRSEI